MSEAYLMTLGQQSLILFIQLAGPMLGLSLVVGLVISIFQAVTQIQDMTLTFIPKIIATIAAFVLFGPWMLRITIEFTYKLIATMPTMVR